MNPDIIVGGVGETGRLPLMIIGETSSDCCGVGLGLCGGFVPLREHYYRGQRPPGMNHEPGLNIAQLLPCEKEGKGIKYQLSFLGGRMCL